MTGAALTGTGNGLDNVLTGNGSNNTLSGAAGNDTLIGGLGNDALAGGNGADVYSYSLGHGADVIDNSSTDSAQDRLNTNLASSDVTFSRSGNDLLMTRNGSATDSVRVTNWFSVANNQLDFVQFTNQTLTNTQINALTGSSLMGLQTQAQLQPSDEWDRLLMSFVDAMNHMGPRRHWLVEELQLAESTAALGLMTPEASPRSDARHHGWARSEAV